MGKTITLDFLEELQLLEEQMKFKRGSEDEKESYYRRTLICELDTAICLSFATIIDFKNVRPSMVTKKKLSIVTGTKKIVFYQYFDHIRVSPETKKEEVIRGVFYITEDSFKEFGDSKLPIEIHVSKFLARLEPLMVFKLKNRSNPGAVWKSLDKSFMAYPPTIVFPINYLYVENAMDYFYKIQSLRYDQDIVQFLNKSY